jgi:hypothetical protein
MPWELTFALVLAIIPVILALAQVGWKDHPRTVFWCRIGTYASVLTLAVILGVWGLGALGMTGLQRWGMSIFGVLFICAWASPWMERRIGFVAPEPAPTLGPAPPTASATSNKPLAIEVQPALSITCEPGRTKKPDSVYIAWPLHKSIFHHMDLPFQFALKPPQPTLDDSYYATCTLHNDSSMAAINVELSFGYFWYPMNQTVTVYLDRQEAIIVPRVEPRSHFVIRFLNGAADKALMLAPLPHCHLEVPGDTTRRQCVLQGADPTRHGRVLQLFPGGKK